MRDTCFACPRHRSPKMFHRSERTACVSTWLTLALGSLVFLRIFSRPRESIHMFLLHQSCAPKNHKRGEKETEIKEKGGGGGADVCVLLHDFLPCWLQQQQNPSACPVACVVFFRLLKDARWMASWICGRIIAVDRMQGQGLSTGSALPSKRHLLARKLNISGRPFQKFTWLRHHVWCGFLHRRDSVEFEQI